MNPTPGLETEIYVQNITLSYAINYEVCIITFQEIEVLAKRDVKVAHCAESNMKLGSGIAAVTKMLEKGMTVGLGTDGCASNNNLDL